MAKEPVASAHDVVAYILQKSGSMTAMTLQKLVYYCQAWSLVWDERPLFGERIEAWVSGPVVPELYERHRGMFEVAEWPHGDADKLDETAIETVDAVLDFYADKGAQWLSDLTHMEDPWRKARKDIPEGERSNAEISWASLMEYYSGLQANGEEEE